MKQEYIETFLEVVNTRNITKASENLHLAQSTVSHHLKVMEEEIGMPLFHRSRGLKKVELTIYGEEFIPIAEDWMNLMLQTEALKKLEHLELNIAVNDSLIDSVICPVLESMWKDSPHIHVSLQTASSSTVYTLAENRFIDIGFAGYEAYRPHISSELAFTETMCVVKNIQDCTTPPSIYHPKHLAEEDEILLRWGAEYQTWHNAHWNSNISPILETDSMRILHRFINRPGRWAVIPRIEADCLLSDTLQICDLGEYAPPNRQIYQVMPRRIRPSHKPAAELFLHHLNHFVRSQPWLELQ